jgi:hypothetical protein
MTKVEFKANYITQFLASYMASRYDFDCQNGHPNKPYDNQPIEDASFLAECAWNQLQKHTQEIRSIPDNIFNFDHE